MAKSHLQGRHRGIFLEQLRSLGIHCLVLNQLLDAVRANVLGTRQPPEVLPFGYSHGATRAHTEVVILADGL